MDGKTTIMDLDKIDNPDDRKEGKIVNIPWTKDKKGKILKSFEAMIMKISGKYRIRLHYIYIYNFKYEIDSRCYLLAST